MSSVRGLASRFYTAEQFDAWAPAAYDHETWAGTIATLRPFVATLRDGVAGYADLQGSGDMERFFVSAGARPLRSAIRPGC